MYGLLINDKPKVTAEQYRDNSDDPNVVYVGSNNIPWFPLLPSTVFPNMKGDEAFKS